MSVNGGLGTAANNLNLLTKVGTAPTLAQTRPRHRHHDIARSSTVRRRPLPSHHLTPRVPPHEDGEPLPSMREEEASSSRRHQIQAVEEQEEKR